jgi:hypothetical protein
MSELQSVKPCNQCEHHYSIGSYNYCTFHTIADTNVVTGEVFDEAILCRYAREEEYCGLEARNYVHRGPEPPISFLSHVKTFFKLFF